MTLEPSARDAGSRPGWILNAFKALVCCLGVAAVFSCEPTLERLFLLGQGDRLRSLFDSFFIGDAGHEVLLSELDSQQLQLRDRFRPPKPERSEALGAWKDRIASLARFLWLSAGKARRDELQVRSAALAFITMLSLVPLLAGLSHFSVGFFADHQENLIEVLSRALPYTEATITQNLSEFLDQSRNLRGFGFFAFLLMALTAFNMIEKSLNDIWAVSRRRSLKSRLNSFILLLFWGPMLIGAAYYGFYFLRLTPGLAPLAETLPVRWGPFVVTWVGLTMLNWQVPNTAVRFRSALLGGGVSTVAIELLRVGFRLYVEISQQMSIVYGSFGLALLFVISIQLSWAIVLAGSELAYCVQNFRFMSRRNRQTAILEGSWIGLAAMLLVIQRFRDHHPTTPEEYLAERLRLSPEELSKILRPLVRAELIQESQDGSGIYLMSCDPYQVPVSELMELYERQQWEILDPLPKPADERLQTLRAQLADARRKAIDELKLADLLKGTDEGAE